MKLFRPRRIARLLAGCAALSLTGFGVAQAAPDLMPVPRNATFDQGSVPFAHVQVVWEGTRPTPLLRRAVMRFQTRLEAIAGPPGAGATWTLHVHGGADAAYLTVREKEHYTLKVGPNGGDLTADGPAGVLHGLATLLQLVDKTPQGPAFADATIDDAPRFPWRGLMIDVARHFMSVDSIERQLDAMELTKLNILHWHLSDGTGFRVESHLYPKLQQVGGHNQYYTQAQVRAVVAYAADRGIRIVPEFDIPGHALSLLQAYPDLAAQQPVPLTKNWKNTCATSSHDGETTTICSQHLNLNNAALDPTQPQVLRFMDALYGEMGALFPDRYFHAGGDEVSAKQWTDNPKIAAYMKAHGYADAPALQAAFTARVEQMLARHGKIMMGWDEVSEAPIPKDVVVEAWRGSKWIGSATKAGHPVVVSSGYYLDLLRPARAHYAVDPFDPKADGLKPDSVKHPISAAESAFMLDPDAPPLDAAQQALVLGGEAPLWSEVVSDEMLDARLWPRSAAIAERFWSPQSVNDVQDMERRLPIVLAELEATGIEATRNQARMIARLTPANITPLTVLTSVTSPVRNYAMNRLAAHSGDEMLNAPAAIAAPDSFDATTFNALAERYASGDRSVTAALRTRLETYAGNDAAYATVANTPLLQAARPVSRQLSALALTGLEAMQPGGHGRAWRARAEDQIAAQNRMFAAVADHASSNHAVLPPSGLLIDIVPGITALVNAAR